MTGVLGFLESQGYPPATEERLTDESLAFAPPSCAKTLPEAVLVRQMGGKTASVEG